MAFSSLSVKFSWLDAVDEFANIFTEFSSLAIDSDKNICLISPPTIPKFLYLIIIILHSLARLHYMNTLNSRFLIYLYPKIE